jgi:peptide/nickel transport system permease protein
VRRYLLRRVFLSVFALWLLTLFVFALLRVLPGNIAYSIYGESTTPELVAAVVQKLGLDKPLYEQYVVWVGDVLRLNLRSFFGDVPVIQIVRGAFPVTLNLALYSMILILAVAVPLGVMAALRRDTWIDHTSTVFAALGLSMPTFWVGILILYGLVTVFDWSPAFSWTSPLQDPVANFKQMIWPALTLAWVHLATIARMTRSSMLESLTQDYITTARGKGLAERTVVWRHALRNALIPIVTLSAIQVAQLLGGSIVVERVFNLRGIGWYLISSVQNRDYAVVEGLILFIAGMVFAVNLFVDLLYSRIDPRISYG